jgi:ribosome-binding factor A
MKSINLQRTESLLCELVPEALASLNDSNINSLTITDVDCKRGKHNAVVYFDGTDFDKEELKIVKQSLKKANGVIKTYCLNSTGWYRCPDFNFVADAKIKKDLRMEELFSQIRKDRPADTENHDIDNDIDNEDTEKEA